MSLTPEEHKQNQAEQKRLALLERLIELKLKRDKAEALQSEGQFGDLLPVLDARIQKIVDALND